MNKRELLLEVEDRVSAAARRIDGLQRICYELANARNEDESVWSIFEEALRASRDELRDGLTFLQSDRLI